MRLLWVPQWTVLPVIVEDREMAEENVQRGRLPVGMDPSARNRLSAAIEGPLPPRQFALFILWRFLRKHDINWYVKADERIENTASGNASYEFNLQGATPQQSGQAFSAPGHQMGRGQPSGAFNMSSIAGALPEYQHITPAQVSQHDEHRYSTGTPGSLTSYQAQQFSQQSPSPMNMPNYSTHSSQYASTFQPGYQTQQSPVGHSGGPSPIHPSYPSGTYFPTQQQQYMYYPGHYVQPIQAHHNPYPSPYAPGPYLQQGADSTVMGGRMSHSVYMPGITTPFTHGPSGPYLRPGSMPVVRRGSSNSSSGSIPSTPRGPPRKPKQSGHALWVGNLPSGTVISDLKDHFSRDATKDIESVFLISKSNCAFVNYRTEIACAAAMTRFHDSRFQGVRLVCRLRRSSAAAASSSGVPTGPAALMPAVAYNQTAFEAIQQNREVSSKAEAEASTEFHRTGASNAKVTDKYFVVKSLTVEDMELSVRNCVWATQAHNEEALNKAYETSDNVYLIFSANKSGEYFGVARMASPISDETAAGLDWAPRGETVNDDPDIPRSIPTAPTATAPKGRIIDDSARGTIFWEADPEDEDLAPIIDHEVDDPELQKTEEHTQDVEESAITGEAQAFGKPFKIEWIATNRLPFYRTRGLRNPWNANREVKIARDGTEIETSVGRRLIQMFQKPAPLEDPPQTVDWPPGQVY